MDTNCAPGRRDASDVLKCFSISFPFNPQVLQPFASIISYFANCRTVAVVPPRSVWEGVGHYVRKSNQQVSLLLRGWKIWLKSQSQGPLAAHPARIIEKMPSYIGMAEGKLLGFNEEGGRTSSEAVVILENKHGWSFLLCILGEFYKKISIFFIRCWVSFTMMWPSDLNTFPENVECF